MFVWRMDRELGWREEEDEGMEGCLDGVGEESLGWRRLNSFFSMDGWMKNWPEQRPSRMARRNGSAGRQIEDD